ncbi:MAG TPA: dockerin type I domain-containing protein, partial [bacterium]|nr:dockerin type I domain-containing protein [bacterium]
VSGGELFRVLHAGGAAARTVFAGVGKSDAELQEALAAGVHMLNVESASELERIAVLAAAAGARPNVALRIIPEVAANTHDYTTTGTIDCSGADGVMLTFYAWLGVEQDSYDHASIGVSGNNGSTWTVIWENTDTLNGGSWDYWEFDISAVAAGSSQVKIRWGMGPTDSGWRYCGWNIDDVEVFAEVPCTQPTPTPEECIHHGDVNFSGEITAGDAQMAFQIALGSYTPTMVEECAADCNGDENVTAGDAQQIFLTALGSGSCADPL